MRGGKEINGNRKVEQRMKKGKSRIGKTFTQCKKGSAKEKGRSDLSKDPSKSDLKREKARKDGLHRAKNEGVPSKNRPKTDLKRGKARKTEILERKRWGGGEMKKWALLPILQCYEVAKSVQMNFSRIFFR